MYAVLGKDHEVIVTGEDVIAWAEKMVGVDKRVALTKIGPRKRGIAVSTVFIGIDLGFQGREWFETMIFGTSLNMQYDRYETWDEAVKGHERMVRRARQARWVRYRRFKGF